VTAFDDGLTLRAEGDNVRCKCSDNHRSSVRILSMLREALKAVEALDERKPSIARNPVTFGGNDEPLVEALDGDRQFTKHKGVYSESTSDVAEIRLSSGAHEQLRIAAYEVQ